MSASAPNKHESLMRMDKLPAGSGRSRLGAGFLYLAAQHRGDLADLGHQLVELVGQDGLHTVGQCVVGTVMDFDNQPIGADRDRGAGKRQYLVAFAGAVAWVNDDRQVA